MNARYNDWLRYVFDHEVKSPEWHFGKDAPCFDLTPEESADFIILTFQNANVGLCTFSDAQINQGLWFLTNSACSEYMTDIRDSNIPLSKQLDVIGSIYVLYADLFAKRCSETLSHLNEKGNELNSICYVFWDICPFTYLEEAQNKDAIEQQILKVLEKTLDIPHRACREGALHGLGEIADQCQEQVNKIIDSFVSRTNLDRFLLDYARGAQRGDIQ